MGRYAFFNLPDGNTYEFKFWFGVQDSEILWAENWVEKEVNDYDEDEAEEMTEEQRETWRKHEGGAVDWDGLSEAEREALKNVTSDHYYASAERDEAEQAEHLGDIQKAAVALGLPELSKGEGETWMEAQSRYTGLISDKSNELYDAYGGGWPRLSERDAATEKALADLDLKVFVWCLLEQFTSFYCSYAV